MYILDCGGTVWDVRSADGYLFIKGAKGKKDRRTILSHQLLLLLRQYYKENKPSYWLFEGQTGGKYSASSVQSIFRKAVKDVNVNPWATVHTLRHSFATHLLQQGIYTHLQKVDNSVVKNPLVVMMKSSNLLGT